MVAIASAWSHRIRHSPYQLLSSFAGNELLISPDGLIEDGLLQASDCEANAFPSTAVDYNSVIPYKLRLILKAWTVFSGRTLRGFAFFF